MPEVSIIMPTYNCAQFITRSINSVLAQSFANWELLIVDDCSTDNTESIIKHYIENDSRFHYTLLKENSGAAVARNIALKQATGKYIAFLDSDDIWLPQKLEKQIAFMQCNNYIFSYHDYVEIDEDDKPLGRYVSGKKRVNKFDMYACCWPGCLSVVYNRENVGLIQIEDIKKNNDSALWLQVIKTANCYLLHENLAQYRKRKGSITPPSIIKRVQAQYPLFRIAQHMNFFSATFFVLLNIVGQIIKKYFYTYKY